MSSPRSACSCLVGCSCFLIVSLSVSLLVIGFLSVWLHNLSPSSCPKAPDSSGDVDQVAADLRKVLDSIFDEKAQPFPKGPSRAFGGHPSASGPTCEEGSCKSERHPSCSTFSGSRPCVPFENRSLTALGLSCRGGPGFGDECAFWSTAWMEAEEYLLGTFSRYGWCYTREEWDDGMIGPSPGEGWDYCVPDKPEAFPGWAPVGDEPCLPWEEVAANPLSRFALVDALEFKLTYRKWSCDNKMLDLGGPKIPLYREWSSSDEHHSEVYLAQRWYAPSGNEWNNRQVGAVDECALPSYVSLPLDLDPQFPDVRELEHDRGFMNASHAHNVNFSGISFQGIDRNILLDAHGDGFLLPYCFTATADGPRATRCLDICRRNGCSGHGTCTVNMSGGSPRKQCDCIPGWEGDACDQPNALHGNLTCEDVRLMGLSDELAGRLSFLMLLPYMIYKDAWEDHRTSGPSWFKAAAWCTRLAPVVVGAGILYGGFGWWAWTTRNERNPDPRIAGMRPVMICIGPFFAVAGFVSLIWLVLPWFALAVFTVGVSPVMPILAYKQVWGLDRAILFCAGPVGFNTFVFLTLAVGAGIAGLLRCCGLWQGAVQGGKHLKEYADLQLQQHHLDVVKWFCLGLANVYSDWSSLLASSLSGFTQFRVIWGVRVGAVMWCSASVSTVVFLASLAIVASLVRASGEAFATEPISIAMRADAPWLSRAGLITLLSLKFVLDDGVQVALTLVSPFLKGATFVPDFTIYSGLFSAYSVVTEARKLCSQRRSPLGRKNSRDYDALVASEVPSGAEMQPL